MFCSESTPFVSAKEFWSIFNGFSSAVSTAAEPHHCPTRRLSYSYPYLMYTYLAAVWLCSLRTVLYWCRAPFHVAREASLAVQRSPCGEVVCNHVCAQCYMLWRPRNCLHIPIHISSRVRTFLHLYQLQHTAVVLSTLLPATHTLSLRLPISPPALPAAIVRHAPHRASSPHCGWVYQYSPRQLIQ